MAEWCEECKEYQDDAYRRPELGGKVLCNQQYYEALRRNSPTGLMRVSAELREEAERLRGER